MPRRTNAQIAADAERDRIAAEAAAADPGTPDAEQKPEPDEADPNAIVRENAVAWWCPRCGHSNTLLTARCGGCGAAREGDRVK